MPVRFAEMPEVIRFVRSPEEEAYQRQDPFLVNLEYRRERRLYSLVLDWKKSNRKDAARELDQAQACKVLLGRSRAKEASARLQVKSVGELRKLARTRVLDRWPLTEMRPGRRDYDLSCVIVLNIIGEFLCSELTYELSKPRDQKALYEAIFHLSAFVLKDHFA